MRTELARRICLLAVALMALFGVGACPGTLADTEQFLVDATSDATADDSGVGAGPDGGNVADSCGDVPTRIFQAQCGNAGCHGTGATQEGLDLVSPGLTTRVVGVSGKGCSGLLANPSQPEVSLLYTKLSAQPPCGAQMPIGRSPLGSADVTCVLKWIAAQ